MLQEYLTITCFFSLSPKQTWMVTLAWNLQNAKLSRGLTEFECLWSSLVLSFRSGAHFSTDLGSQASTFLKKPEQTSSSPVQSHRTQYLLKPVLAVETSHRNIWTEGRGPSYGQLAEEIRKKPWKRKRDSRKIQMRKLRIFWATLWLPS